MARATEALAGYLLRTHPGVPGAGEPARNWSAWLRWHEVDVLLGDAAAGAAQMPVTLRLTAELFEVITVLEQAGVEAMPFKGPALAWELYDSPVLRPCCDLDFLIRRGSIRAAVAALEAAGFRSDYQVGMRLYEAYRHYGLERDGCIVELHWGLMPGGHAYGGDVAGVFARSRQVPVGGRCVRTLAVEDLLPYLCLHAAKHRWDKAKWVVDIERVLARHAGTIDWPRLWRTARRGGYVRALGVGLELARVRTGAVLPPDAAAGIGRSARRLAARVDWSRPATRLECIRYQVACADWRRKLPVALSFVRPTPSDGVADRGYGAAVRARLARAIRLVGSGRQ